MNRKTISAASVLLAFTAIAGAVEPAGPGMAKISHDYPWQRLPVACKNMPACKVEDWPAFDTAVYRIQTLFEQAEFAGLERAFADMAANNRKFESGKTLASAVYLGMRQAMPTSRVDQKPGATIDRWRKKYPKSIWVPFAQARYEYALAWNARTQQSASAVSEEGWAAFKDYLARAKATLDAASPELKNQPIFHNLMLAIILDLEGVAANAGAIYYAAVERWPDHYEFYDLMISRLVPQWGGSWATIDEFIEEAAEQRKAIDGRSIYARLYLNLTADEYFPIKETTAQWHELKKGFDDLVTRYPDPHFLNMYASHACLYKDAETYAKVMSRLTPQTLREGDWVATTSTRNCPR